jgi:hypothetical protein
MTISHWPDTMGDDCRAVKVEQGFLPERAGPAATCYSLPQNRCACEPVCELSTPSQLVGGHMRKLVCTLLIVLAGSGSLVVHAQATSSKVIPHDTEATALSADAIARSVERWAREEPAQRDQPVVPKQQKRIGTGTRALIIAGSAVGGFFAGGFLGHQIEREFAPCNCDDPGLKGALIGAPIGAIAGGVIAAISTR